MFKKLSFILGLVIFVIFAFLVIKSANLNQFIDSIESRTFDLRQNLIINEGVRKPNKDIVIVAIDDASYEYILDTYGEWPLPRDVYANIVNYLEKQNPKSIAFDLMFVKSLKSQNSADELLINSFKKYNNIYTSMNFDNQSEDLRVSPILPKKLTVKVKNDSKINFEDLTFINCRTILDGIINATSNIGIINVSRSDDGVLRKMPVVVKYKDDFYPQLALKVGLDYVDENPNDISINKKSLLKVGSRLIYLDKDGSAILNWYGPVGSYDYIPLYQLIKASNGQKTDLSYDFSNKVVYFGATASSLFDIKTVPSGKVYPGVEVQATYVNNIIDNNFIRKVDRTFTVVISLVLALLIAGIVAKISLPFAATIISLSVYFAYLLVAYYMMRFGNIWLEVIYPLIFSIFAFTFAFIIKYLVKSRDFELQYKLATTDGLTELYNHRYFQEQLRMQIEHSKRYENSFSLIIIDIDFFKKFNDNFGHQSGDAVLRQVAQTLKKNVRATDIVCRYGGEEMSIILPNTNNSVAYSTANKICERVANHKFRLANNKEANVTISLGVSTFPEDGNSATELIEAADKRLYDAKNSGRNQVK